jgi:hypothetical protein
MSVEHPEGLVEDAGRRGEARRLDQMISVRLDPLLVAALRKLADARGISLSDVLRDAAVQMLAREEAHNVRTFRVEVTNETRPEAKHQSYRQDVPVAVLQPGREHHQSTCTVAAPTVATLPPCGTNLACLTSAGVIAGQAMD